MGVTSLQEILPLVEMPSRYLGSEINAVKKSASDVKLSVALVFPDIYEIGTSHFGLQILYSILNTIPEIAAERVFTPAVDMQGQLKCARLPLVSLESKRQLTDFDIIGFSLLYELNYTNVLSTLDMAKIPFFSHQRNADLPLIIAGGPCTCNPEPVADFFDAMVVGDGETVILDICQEWLQWKNARSNRHKEDLLRRLDRVQGVYIPRFYTPKFNAQGIPLGQGGGDEKKAVERAVIPDLETVPFPRSPIIPFARPVHDRLRLEVARGCTRGCRFCQAGMIYRPVRERSVKKLISLCDDSLAATGYEDISLLSLSTGDFGGVEPLLAKLMKRYAASHHAVSFPSLRAGTLTPELMRLVKKVRKTGFTIAPEAGSQRLRDVINKNISEKDILDTVENVFRHGWQVIKLYFMVGLPTEDDADLRAILELVNRIRRQPAQKGRRSKLNISVATFIPKPHTPFQWHPQIALEVSKEKIAWLREQLDKPGIHFKWQNPEVSFIEGLWARGDRRLSKLLVGAYQKGCRFDGWSDHFNFARWEEAIDEAGIDIDFYMHRQRSPDEPLPWDHIDIGVSKAFLHKEWEKAIQVEPTEDCRRGNCHACGVCDFEMISPRIFQHTPDETVIDHPTDPEKKDLFIKWLLKYSKLDDGRFFGHLELVNIMTRAIRRAKIPIRYSQGFHPKPKISFYDPLPIGMESAAETMTIEVARSMAPREIRRRLNRHLPNGILIQECQYAPKKKKRQVPAYASYKIRLNNHRFDPQKISEFKQKSTVVYNQTNKKGKAHRINLKEAVLKMDASDGLTLNLTLNVVPGKMVRPAAILKSVFGLPEEEVRRARVLKLAEPLAEYPVPRRDRLGQIKTNQEPS